MDCDLPVDPGCCGEDWATYTPEVQATASAAAWRTLNVLTGQQVGNCPLTVRPCRQGCSPPPTYATWPVGLAGHTAPGVMNPAIVGGQWTNIACGCGAAGCSCTNVCQVVFPGRIASVEEITLDGVTLDPTAYRVDNGNLLVRQDDDCWPLCQDMRAPLGEAGTFGVTYTPGIAPNAAAERAAGALACEYAKACTGAKCRLPANVTSVQRQGVSLEITADGFPGGLTGIRAADEYIRSINPYGLRTPSVVWSPDTASRRVTTWSA